MKPGERTFDALDEGGRREYWATLALRCMEGLDAHTVCALLRHYGSAFEAYSARSGWAGAGIVLPTGMREPDDAWRMRAKPEWDAVRRDGAAIILWTDPLYPRQLRDLEDAPALLYARGRTEMLARPVVAVIGSRESSPEAADMASSFSGALSSMGVAVVSGMADDAASHAHVAAMRSPGKSIAVLESGLGVACTALNSGLCRKLTEEGLVVSELPPDFPAGPKGLQMSSRIVYGLSRGVFVAMMDPAQRDCIIMARHAIACGRKVYVPAQVALHWSNSEAAQQLIEEGAQPVSGAAQIVADLFPQRIPDAQLERPAGLTADTCSLPNPSVAQPLSQQAEPIREERSQGEEGIEAEQCSSTTHALFSEEPIRHYRLRDKPILTMPGIALTPQTDEENAVLDILALGPVSVDVLLCKAKQGSPRLNWSEASISAVLKVLAIKGLVRRRADLRYEAAR